MTNEACWTLDGQVLMDRYSHFEHVARSTFQLVSYIFQQLPPEYECSINSDAFFEACSITLEDEVSEENENTMTERVRTVFIWGSVASNSVKTAIKTCHGEEVGLCIQWCSSWSGWLQLSWSSSRSNISLAESHGNAFKVYSCYAKFRLRQRTQWDSSRAAGYPRYKISHYQ